jgi:hypothetical protein
MGQATLLGLCSWSFGWLVADPEIADPEITT